MQRKEKTQLLRTILAVVMLLSTVVGVYLSRLINERDKTEIISLMFLSVILFITLFFYIHSSNSDMINTRNKQLIIFFVYEILLLSVVIMIKVPYLLLPISIGSMLIALIIDKSFAIIFNGFFALLAAILSQQSSTEILIFYLISGTVACLIANYTKKRNNIVWVAFTLISLNVALSVLMDYYFDNSISYNHIIYSLLNASFSVIITVGSLPLFEALFDIITPTKLLEISNSDQKLIQKLLKDAPGTFHHSQWVANLSEMAAMDIGSDYQLARAGALYHDIGKLKAPEYFKENQTGTNIHDNLEPIKSAEIILSHVSYGSQLANEYRLPKAIKNIIRQHQGTTVLKYFYKKATDKTVLEEVNISDYTYKGPLPQTNEAAIVMLADSVEAAVRSIPQAEKNLENLENTIHNVIKVKFEEGQLDESNLKIKELNIIANSFLKVYKGMNHDRIIKEKE